MILSLTAVNKDQAIQHFFCTVDDVDSGLEVLSFVVLQGDSLLEAYVIYENGRLNLPTDIFDGQPFQKPIRRLEKQWERILNKSLGKGSVHALELVACLHQLMDSHQGRLNHDHQCIARLTGLQQRARHTLTDEATRSGLFLHYQGLIDTHRASIARLEGWQRVNQVRVGRLAK